MTPISGIAGFGLPGVIANLFDRSDLVVPGQPASEARRQDIGILDFETPKNMNELVLRRFENKHLEILMG